MKTNGYFNNLEKYWSANFLAFISLFSIIFPIYAFIRHNLNYRPDAHIHFLDPSIILLTYVAGFAVLGFSTLFTIFPLSISIISLLRTINKKTMFFAFIGFLLTFIIILFFIGDSYVGITEFSGCIGLAYTYVHGFMYFVPIFIAIPVVCILDSKKNCIIPNTTLINNNVYKTSINFLFYYFWLMYVPFVLGLILCLNLYLDLHFKH